MSGLFRVPRRQHGGTLLTTAPPDWKSDPAGAARWAFLDLVAAVGFDEARRIWAGACRKPQGPRPVRKRGRGKRAGPHDPAFAAMMLSTYDMLLQAHSDEQIARSKLADWWSANYPHPHIERASRMRKIGRWLEEREQERERQRAEASRWRGKTLLGSP